MLNGETIFKCVNVDNVWYEYDKNNNLIYQKYSDENGKWYESWYEYKYNSKNQIIEKIEYTTI